MEATMRDELAKFNHQNRALNQPRLLELPAETDLEDDSDDEEDE